MRDAYTRPMSLEVRPIDSDTSGTRWHWSVYDDPRGDFVRNGQIVGDREEAEQAARMAICVMGGVLRDAPD